MGIYRSLLIKRTLGVAGIVSSGLMSVSEECPEMSKVEVDYLIKPRIPVSNGYFISDDSFPGLPFPLFWEEMQRVAFANSYETKQKALFLLM